MEIDQDLREQKAVFQAVAQMMTAVGMECEEKKMEDAARKAYASAYWLMKRMSQIDRALAVLDGDVMRVYELDLVCKDCGAKNGVRAVANVLAPEHEQEWNAVLCSVCDDGQVGFVRMDDEKAPVGYMLTLSGVIDAEWESKSPEEHKKDALAIQTDTPIQATDLPQSNRLRAMLLGEFSGTPVGVNLTRKEAEMAIEEKLAKAKNKIPTRAAVETVPEPGEDDEF